MGQGQRHPGGCGHPAGLRLLCSRPGELLGRNRCDGPQHLRTFHADRRRSGVLHLRCAGVAGGTAHRAWGREPDAVVVLCGRPDRGDLAAAGERPGGAGQPGEPGGGDDPRAGPDGGAGGGGGAEDRAAAAACGRPGGAAARHHQGSDRAGVEASGRTGGGGAADGALVPAGARGSGPAAAMTTTRPAGGGTGVRTAPAAFFYVAKNLLPGSSMYLFARGLYRHGFYDLRDIAGFAFGQLVFRLTGAEGRRGMEAAREQALAFIEGKRRDDLTQIGHDIVVEVIGPRIYPGMRKVIDAHHADGDKTYLVTAAPKELAQGIAAYLGMDGGLGTEGELVDGVYTGRLVGPVLHGPAKFDAVVRLAGEHGFDLHACSAYSDSVNDRPLLEGVGRPVAVNPDRHLRDLAAERGWPVQDF